MLLLFIFHPIKFEIRGPSASSSGGRAKRRALGAPSPRREKTKKTKQKDIAPARCKNAPTAFFFIANNASISTHSLSIPLYTKTHSDDAEAPPPPPPPAHCTKKKDKTCLSLCRRKQRVNQSVNQSISTHNNTHQALSSIPNFTPKQTTPNHHHHHHHHTTKKTTNHHYCGSTSRTPNEPRTAANTAAGVDAGAPAPAEGAAAASPSSA